MIVYKAVNKINGKVYVGQTVQSLNVRIHQHWKDAKRRNHPFPTALRKYGKENFEIETIAWCDSRDKLDFLEKFYIGYFQSTAPRGYNIAGGGLGRSCYEDSEETKKKKSISRRLYILNHPEEKTRLGVIGMPSGSRNPNHGGTRFYVYRKISKAAKGRPTWNRGKKAVQIPWNKNKKGLQVAWNKGLKKEDYLARLP